MRTRRLIAASALVALVTPLAACAGTAGPAQVEGCTPAYDTTGPASEITVAGGGAEVPRVETNLPVSVNEPSTYFAEAGSGRRAQEGDLVLSDVTVFDGRTGELMFATQLYGAPERIVAGGEDTGAFIQSVRCAAKGARIITAATMQDAQVNLSGPTIGLGDPIVLVYDVQAVFPGRAEGTLQPGNSNLPAVTVDQHGQPGLSFTNAPPPTELTVATTIEGRGRPLQQGDAVVLQYTGVLWQTREVFDSTWHSANPRTPPGVEGSYPAVFELQPGALIDGFYNGLIGQRVGSQVVIAIPEDQGYGPGAGPGAMVEGAVLVFVVDILGTVDAE